MDKIESQRPAARALQTVRNLLVAISIYLIVTTTLQFLYYGSPTSTRPSTPSSRTSQPSQSELPSSSAPQSPSDGGGSLSAFASRPDSLVVANDAYMGTRPHADTFANFTRLVDVCRGTQEGLERMTSVHECMRYLSTQRDDYYYMPTREEAPSHGYPSFVAASESSIGTCNGPVVPYHVWWSGKCTWRVELFLKSYLHSQNLPCSRLNLWLDHDSNPFAIDDMMRDPGFVRFLPLVRRGDIKLREWRFPGRVLLRKAGDGEGNGKIIKLGDGAYIDERGDEWLEFSTRKMTFLPVAVSDAVRFVVLHYEGGVYCDMDNVLLRDLRPFLLQPNHGFAERWAWQRGGWDYNTAIMSLHPNSSLSQHFLKGAVKMGINFHPYIIGRLVYKDGRGEEFTMFEDGFFDPIWGQFNSPGVAKCTVPCLGDYGLAFLGRRGAVPTDWATFNGPQLQIVDGGVSGDAAGENARGAQGAAMERARGWIKRRVGAVVKRVTNEGYDMDKDPYPPTNRTLENFFRGAYAYHIHNQWAKHPEPNSWLDVVCKTHDGFLSGSRVNMYGERWAGPRITRYEKFPEFT
ncbi:hypothetical protein DRE_03983 [Drechslerella stenobrocha 248]|uniref:Alpha 1,4-glycosyltransferase domain-containing protein n=1 Tax=Drechslerella stenobrocha 248 TaxID=1043628 RepID=W7I3H0_9PEZI|nr:hypothetical protein DRE_03983 [Drechslerella stenobrocha 248]